MAKFKALRSNAPVPMALDQGETVVSVVLERDGHDDAEILALLLVTSQGRIYRTAIITQDDGVNVTETRRIA